MGYLCGDRNVLHLYHVHVNILVVILYYNFARCYHGGGLGKGYWNHYIILSSCMSLIHKLKDILKYICFTYLIVYIIKENNKSKYETTTFWVDMGSSGQSGSKDNHISEQSANI